MGTRSGWLAVLVTAGMAVAGVAHGQAQDYTQPDHVFPLPLFHDRPETGGFYTTFEFVFMRETNPLEHQLIAVRGFFDQDGSITGHPGQFVGGGQPALYADDAGGPGTFQPGFNIGIGYRFDNRVAVEFSWLWLAEAKYAAGANILGPGFQNGQNLANTFISSFVYNFPVDFAGEDRKVDLGNLGATFGIWNAASDMTISLIQRFEHYDITARIPILDNDDGNFRCYGLLGPRLTWFWEKFDWRTVSRNDLGQADATDVAIYTNRVSNRLYGIHLGGGNEWNWGDTPIGSFACSLDLQAGLFADIVGELAKYERGDGENASSRQRKELEFVPEVEAQLNIWYYPIEGVVFRVGYQAMAFWNTVASPNPVSFNFLGLDPPWEHEFRILHGLNAGVGFIF
jgi:hypothetical protein